MSPFLFLKTEIKYEKKKQKQSIYSSVPNMCSPNKHVGGIIATKSVNTLLQINVLDIKSQ